MIFPLYCGCEVSQLLRKCHLIGMGWCTAHSSHECTTHSACVFGHCSLEIVPFVLSMCSSNCVFSVQAGAKVNITAGGATPLHIAADNGSPEIINSLLKAGADPNVTDEVRGSVSLFFGTSLFICRKKTCFMLGICLSMLVNFCWSCDSWSFFTGLVHWSCISITVIICLALTGPLFLEIYICTLSVSTFSFLTITVTFTALSVSWSCNWKESFFVMLESGTLPAVG